MNNPSLIQVEKAMLNNVWHFGNEILYKMCSENFDHKNNEHILTKVLFIGRIYAAAIERRKTKNNDINDNFYIDKVVPAFQNSDIDKYLNKLKNFKSLNNDNLKSVLETHFYLTKIINKITEQNKRSLVSKYLHFHLPELFFIYDTRAVEALRNYKTKVPSSLKHIIELENVDIEYAKFFCKCYELQKEIQEKFSLNFSIRHLDNLLIENANFKNSEKRKLL
ncbi:hypothetical protein [Flavobacterium nitrogenifigens]|uniref:Uncharacterized protein n=1 Tax=Flavobacterium nitrogenifigens TaxID=1617283 RepID=A0A521ALY7_9FLAO|nr:hypothetical protein [Flavobacterium nitrogenifigens]KAF2339083.1 hypothetical protein DM397_01940 [Flavobacterium nitrogenifigens]SMO35819.1 hypothetical protein SAMN06265220_101272 [Flavobacterium nitrogenifigens]